MTKFTQGYDQAFLGAEPFENNADPFYLWTEKYCIIVDASGVSLNGYNEENDYPFYYATYTTLNETEAKKLVEYIESNVTGFVEMAELLFELNEI